MKHPLISCVRFLQWKLCGGCESKTIPGLGKKLGGFHLKILLRLYVSIRSAYDTEAHYSKKRSTTQVGFNVRLLETCEKMLLI